MSTSAGEARRIGFISTRIAGTDGVSLEIGKWARVLEEMGLECYYIAGECDRPPERTALIDEGHFAHPVIEEITERAFGAERRDPALTDGILRLARVLERRVRQAVEGLGLDAVIVENALSIPMNIPLGIGLVSFLQETRIDAVVHHHDFYWERPRYLVNCVQDFLEYAFPPALSRVKHVAINSLGGQEMSRRTGQSCRVVPNVMDFDHPPAPPDEYAGRFRTELGLGADDVLVLQPTRVVLRKNIEHTIELARRLDRGRTKVVITHATGDEGQEYAAHLCELAELMGVELVFVGDRIAPERGADAQGRPLFTVADAYAAADIVAYPSGYEGFGNVFLEAVYYRKPLVCNRYSIYRTDIEPCGARPIVFDGFISKDTVAAVRRVLAEPAWREEMVEHNYRVAARHFGFHVLRGELALLLGQSHSLRPARPGGER